MRICCFLVMSFLACAASVVAAREPRVPVRGRGGLHALRLITLGQPWSGQMQAAGDEASNEVETESPPCAECAIETDTFLEEPAPQEKLFQHQERFSIERLNEEAPQPRPQEEPSEYRGFHGFLIAQ